MAFVGTAKKSVFERARRIKGKEKAGQKPKIEPVQSYFQFKRTGHKLAKGTTMFDDVNRPSFMTREEAEEFERVRRNANKRVYRLTKKVQAMFPEMSREELIQRSIIPAPFRKSILDLKNRGQLSKFTDLMKNVTSANWKAEKTEIARNKFITVARRAYSFPDEAMDWVEDTLNSMSIEELLDWEYKNPMIISDIFFAYTDDNGVIKAEELEEARLEFALSLAKYSKVQFDAKWLE